MSFHRITIPSDKYSFSHYSFILLMTTRGNKKQWPKLVDHGNTIRKPFYDDIVCHLEFQALLCSKSRDIFCLARERHVKNP